MIAVDKTLAPYGAFVLRVGLGTMWVAHALLKWFVFTMPGFATWLVTQGLSAELAWPVFVVELTGGIAIVLGFYGRYVAFF
jgi:putative oxidoreductase